MGILRSPAYNYYDWVVSEELVAALNGTDLIAQGENPPQGTETITKDKLKQLTGEAKLGKPGQPVPRELGELETDVVHILQITHGFYLHYKKLQANQNFGTSLPDTQARLSSRLVNWRINDMIFNGNSGYKVTGILDTTKEVVVASGSEWNSNSGGNPYGDLQKAFMKLRQGGIFAPKKVGLKPAAYEALFNLIPNTSVTHAELLAKRLPNGMNDIIEIPIGLPAGTDGIVCDYGPLIAERYVEEDINLKEKMENEDGNIPFNIETYQGMHIKEINAFVKLKNLLDPTKLTMTPMEAKYQPNPMDLSQRVTPAAAI